MLAPFPTAVRCVYKAEGKLKSATYTGRVAARSLTKKEKDLERRVKSKGKGEESADVSLVRTVLNNLLGIMIIDARHQRTT